MFFKDGTSKSQLLLSLLDLLKFIINLNYETDF